MGINNVNDKEDLAPMTRREVLSLVLAVLLLGLLFVWNGSLPIHHKLAYSSLIPLLFMAQRWFSPLSFAEESLRNKIITERERLCPGSSSRWQWGSLQRIYDPSPFSVVAIVFFGILINLPAFYFPWLKSFISVESLGKADFFNNLIAVHAGIGAIIFALLIFVAESLRDDTKERASVLLKESLLFPLTLLEIITLLFFIGFDYQNLLVGIPIFFVGCLAIYSLYKLMRILLSPYAFQEKRLSLLKDRVRKSINEALNERIGNNILHQLLGSDQVALSTGYFSRRDRKDSVAFKLNENGIVRDINIDVLLKISELVEEQANSKGMSFFENKPKHSASSSEEEGSPSTTEAEHYSKLQKWDATLTKFYRQRIDPESNVVLVIHKRIAGEDVAFEQKINNLLQGLFVIGKEDNFSEEIKLELEALRDQFVEAVQQMKITKIDYFRNVYLSLTETFLELVGQCGGGYTPEQAKKEMSASAFKEGWPEIEWLDDHLRDIYLASIATHNKEIIRKVAFTPIAIAIRGIRKNDHFIFLKFIKYARSLHYEALQLEQNDPLREDLMYHATTWVKEVGDFYIEPELEEDPGKIQFASQLLIELQGMLKHSSDKADYESFEKVLDTLTVLLKRFKPSRNHPNVEHLTLQLDRIVDPTHKEDVSKRIEEQTALENAERDFWSKKRQLLFGFTAWTFKHLRKSNLDPQNRRRFFDRLKSLQPLKIEDLTETFVQTHSHDTQDRFEWYWWDVVPDGEVHSINFEGDIEYLYILLALELLSRKTPEEIAAINLPPSRDLAFMGEDNSPLNSKLDLLSSAPNFDLFISEQAIEKVPFLKALLSKAKKAQEEIERVKIMERPLSSKKVEEFQNLFLKEFYQHATMRALFKTQGKFVDISSGTDTEPTSVDLIGINQIDRKEGFFENWYVHYIGWGEQYGEGFAKSEDIEIYEKISSDASEKRDMPFADFIPMIEEILKQKSYSKPFIFSPFAYNLELQELRASEKFIPSWSQNKSHKGYDKYPFYIGFLEFKSAQVPVFRVVGPKEKETRDACLVDMGKIGTFFQYPPIKDPEDKESQKDIFLFRIIDLNADNERRQKILDEKPGWLDEKSDPEAYLRGKVLFNIYAKFEFKIEDTDAAVYFKFTDQDQIEE